MYRKDEIALDLTDPTGRVHAAWWASSIHRATLPPDEEAELVQLYVGATAAPLLGFWTPEHITRFRDLCLRLAS